MNKTPGSPMEIALEHYEKDRKARLQYWGETILFFLTWPIWLPALVIINVMVAAAKWLRGEE